MDLKDVYNVFTTNNAMIINAIFEKKRRHASRPLSFIGISSKYSIDCICLGKMENKQAFGANEFCNTMIYASKHAYPHNDNLLQLCVLR